MDQKKALNQLETLGNYAKKMRLAAEQWKTPFQTLISIILSARTRDETTIKVAHELFKNYSTPKNLANAKLIEIEKIVKPVNFYKNKSKNILNCAKALVNAFNSVVPTDLDNLLKLPGVGRKTANVFISEYGSHAIGVDTHVSYISQYLGWTKNKIAEKIEADLKELFPKDYWSKVNPILVRFGKTYTSRIEKNKILDKIK